MKARILFVATTMVLAATGIAFSGTDEDIAEYKALLNDFKLKLESKDQTERWATVEIGLQHDNALIRKLAKDIGFASDDAVLQTRALVGYLKGSPSLAVRFGDPDQPDETQTELITRYSHLTIQPTEYDSTLDQFKNQVGPQGHRGQCRIIEQGFECQFKYMRLDMRIASPSILAGSGYMVSTNGRGTPVVATIHMQ